MENNQPYALPCIYCGAMFGHFSSCRINQDKGDYPLPVEAYSRNMGRTAMGRTAANPKQAFGDKKVALGAVLPVAMVHEGMAMMEGDFKYGFRNFRNSKVEAMTYIHAAMRHIESWAEGEEVAEDSGVHHLGHARACLGILLDAQETGKLIDNRVPGVFSKVLARMETWVQKRRAHYDKKTNTNAAPVKSHEDHQQEIDTIYNKNHSR